MEPLQRLGSGVDGSHSSIKDVFPKIQPTLGHQTGEENIQVDEKSLPQDSQCCKHTGFRQRSWIGAAGGDRCCLVAPWWQIWEHLTRLAYSAVRSRGPRPPRYNEARLYSRRATAAIWQTMHFARFFFSVSVSC